MLLTPLEQFQILSLLSIKVLYINFSLTNLALISLIVILMYSIIVYFFSSSTNYLNEISFYFVSVIFTFILFSNLIGLIPYSFTVTSHLIVTFTLSLSVFIGVNIICIQIYKMEMLPLTVFKTIKSIVFNLSFKIIHKCLNNLSFTTNGIFIEIFNLLFSYFPTLPTLLYGIFGLLFSCLPFLGYGIKKLLYEIFGLLFSYFPTLPTLLYEIFNLLFSYFPTLIFLLFGITPLLYELKIDLLPIFKDFFKDLLDELTINLRNPINIPGDSNQQDPGEPDPAEMDPNEPDEPNQPDGGGGSGDDGSDDSGDDSSGDDSSDDESDDSDGDSSDGDSDETDPNVAEQRRSDVREEVELSEGSDVTAGGGSSDDDSFESGDSDPNEERRRRDIREEVDLLAEIGGDQGAIAYSFAQIKETNNEIRGHLDNIVSDDNNNLTRESIVRLKVVDKLLADNAQTERASSERLDDLLEKEVRYNTTAWGAGTQFLETVWRATADFVDERTNNTATSESLRREREAVRERTGR